MMVKTPVKRRGADFGRESEHLFDIALCQHKDMASCSCEAGSKVPPNWREFLLDQRGDRKSKALYSERVKSLREGVRDLSDKEKEDQVEAKRKIENKEKRRRGWRRGKESQKKVWMICSE